jgi:hypothetical protein
MADFLEILFHRISEIDEVRSIGVSGELKFPKAGEGDVDVFIYCSDIPPLNARQAALNCTDSVCSEAKTGVIDSEFWGSGDLVLINGVEIWLMYFTEKDTEAFISSVLKGDYPDKLDNYFYPTGRCAMLQNISVIYDKDCFLNSMKHKLSTYPDPLAEKLISHHLDALSDIEDLERAVAGKDVLFYHFALDIALDHFLQALFALNRTFFPSRKRSFQYVDGFINKPERCAERLVSVLESGGRPEELGESYRLWEKLISDLEAAAAL